MHMMLIRRFYFYCGGVYYMNAMYNLKRLGKLRVLFHLIASYSVL